MNENLELSSMIMSDLKGSIIVPFKISRNVSKKQKKNSSLFENKIVTKPISDKYLEAKHLRMKNMIDLKEDFFKKKRSTDKYSF